ncbi:MAG: ATP-binding cassette domain-containing protein [Bradymonadaceae bacterium]|nr:ATP-binding cassette domain-containing protein [Lujinxingiaceae bacterium]
MEKREVVISLENVVAGYGKTPILRDLNLELERGQITALLGGSGSGKSTLLKTMTGLLPPLEGTVRLLGHEMYRLDQAERSALLRRTGMLFQYGALFGSRTVFDNIALPLREHTALPESVIAEMVRMKLALVGLEGLEARLPSEISGGQRKRVALARASILDPEVIFCDEPSAGLDPIVAAGLDDTLRRFQSLFGMSLVVVTHELESIKFLADRVIMLAGNAVVAVGTVEELSKSAIKNVYDFFHRVPPDYVTAGSSMLEWVEKQGEPKADG